MSSNIKKVLFLGDVVGRPGRRFLKERLPAYRADNGYDLVVANGENAAGGAGVTGKIALELLDSGLDCITLGDHVWDQKNFQNEIDGILRVCRPANLPLGNPGRDRLVVAAGDFRIGFFTVLGRSFMRPQVDCPFATADRIISELRDKADAVVAEIHAEATSEKIAFGWHMDGKVAAVVGTHTHVPTADARILPGGTAYQTDLGMTGPRQSVLGREVGPCLDRFLDGMPRKCPVAEADVGMQGVAFEIDLDSGSSISVHTVELREES